MGKACKPIPVLLLSVIVGRKRYNYSKYGCVVLLVIGVTIFLYKPAESHVHQVEKELNGVEIFAKRGTLIIHL